MASRWTEPREEEIQRGVKAQNSPLLSQEFDEETHVQETEVFTTSDHQDFKDQSGFFKLKDVFDPDKEKYTYAEDRVHAYAKHVKTNKGDQYFVKVSTVDGRPLDPINGNDKDNLYRFYKHKGKPSFVYKRVPPVVFYQYVRFLQTKNHSHLRQAEREIL